MRPRFAASSHNMPKLPSRVYSIVPMCTCAWVRTDDTFIEPTQFWNEIHCACAHDNICQAPVPWGPRNEANIIPAGVNCDYITVLSRLIDMGT